MIKVILIKIIGILGVLLILYGYYLLGVPPDTEFNEVVRRAKGGMAATVTGGIMLLFYIARR